MKILYRLTSICILSAAMTLVNPEEASADLVVTQTTNSSVLGGALQGNGVTITNAVVVNGIASQFGTYTGFTSPPITIGNGIVLSSGNVVDVKGPASSGDSPATDLGVSGTSEFDAYGASHIVNFQGSYDVAALQIDFTLGSASQVQFDLVFGSIEFPNWVNQYADSVLAFLDGKTSQIIFDSHGNPVDVGSSFTSLLSTKDTNTAFGSPHGVLGLTTTTALLGAGHHSLLFEVGDVNDHILDSAAFISNLRTGSGTVGTVVDDNGGYQHGTVPEPSSFALLGLGGLGLAFGAYRRRMTAVV